MVLRSRDESEQDSARLRWPDWLSGALLLLLGVLAFGAALGLRFDEGLPSSSAVGSFFFASSRLPPGLVLAVAGWLAWRRSPRLRARATRPDARSKTTALAGRGLFVACILLGLQARLFAAPDLLLPSLSMFLLGAATIWAGAGGFRTMLLPALTICLALPIPSPLDSEILWRLQILSAEGAAGLLSLLGYPIERVGIHLLLDETRFLVVETCSGQRAMLTLALVAVVLRDLFDGAASRSWLIIAISPLLAYFVNIARIAIIVLQSAGEEIQPADDHIGQGLATLAVGSVILFVVGHFVAGRPVERQHDALARWRDWPSRSALACLFALLLVSYGGPAWPPPDPRTPELRDFPEAGHGWTSESVTPDWEFIGLLPRSQLLRRMYERERSGRIDVPHRVALYGVVQDRRHPRSSPWSSKLLQPGRLWEVETRESVYDHTLGRELIRVIATDGTERVLAYSWMVHGESAGVDSMRSFLALERGPFARANARVVLRIEASIDGAGGESGAKQALDRFLFDFREELQAL
jgi:exosortase